MKYQIAVTLLVLALSSQAQAQLPAQRGTPGSGNRPTTAPSGKKIQGEPEKASAKLTPKAGSNKPARAAAVVVPQQNFMVGINGYPSPDNDGIVLLSTLQRRDLDRGNKVRCPVKEIQVDFRGNGKLINMYLEPGDKITSIDGFEVKNMEQLMVAVNSATNPHDMEITFIDWKTGNEYTGTIDAMRVR